MGGFVKRGFKNPIKAFNWPVIRETSTSFRNHTNFYRGFDYCANLNTAMFDRNPTEVGHSCGSPKTFTAYV